jgi:hypothetical protein
MISWDSAWARTRECPPPWMQGKKKSDFRSLNYTQKFEGVAVGSASGNLLQSFPAGAFILGIDACAKVPRVVKVQQYYADANTITTTFDRWESTTPGNTDLFSLNFQYTNDENITPGGPTLAAALMGPMGGMFPVREIIIDPSQGILCSAKNEATFLQYDGSAAPAGFQFTMDIHVRYACMVPRAVG